MGLRGAQFIFFALSSAALRITQVLSTLFIGLPGRSNMFPPRGAALRAAPNTSPLAAIYLGAAPLRVAASKYLSTPLRLEPLRAVPLFAQ